jgi:hypothetical protein
MTDPSIPEVPTPLSRYPFVVADSGGRAQAATAAPITNSALIRRTGSIMSSCLIDCESWAQPFWLMQAVKAGNQSASSESSDLRDGLAPKSALQTGQADCFHRSSGHGVASLMGKPAGAGSKIKLTGVPI